MRRRLLATAIAVAIPVLLSGRALAAKSHGTAFAPRPDVEYYAYLPQRPSNSSKVHLAVGRFERYTLLTRPIFQMVLTLRDATGKDKEYVLSPGTTLDGTALHCNSAGSTALVKQYAACTSLPAYIVPGKVDLAVLYWQQDFDGLSLLGTDTIVSIP